MLYLNNTYIINSGVMLFCPSLSFGCFAPVTKAVQTRNVFTIANQQQSRTEGGTWNSILVFNPKLTVINISTAGLASFCHQHFKP